VILLTKSEVLALHHRLIDEFGGSHGLLDEGALESALIAVENRRHYEDADLVACAATYPWHLAQAHAFLDGNKRVAAAVTEAFLVANGAALHASDDELFVFYMGIAASERTREKAERWLRRRVVEAAVTSG
jgi:death-on-curing protein